MCFILTAIKLKENDEVKNAILGVLESQQGGNPDGTASLCFGKDQKPVIKRDVCFSRVEMKNDLDNFDYVNYHFRTATVGAKTLKNVHFWKMGNWAFCHNGGVSEMGDVDESDSYKFFKDLYDKNYLQKNNNLKGQKIKDYTNRKSFWGRFLIINLITKNIYFFGDFELYLINKSYLVFTSTKETFENSLDIMGLKFDVEDTIETMESAIEGVWMFDFKGQQFRCIFESFREFVGYQGYGKSRARETHNHTIAIAETTATCRSFNFESKREESDNLNNNEVLASKLIEKKDKVRTDESYIKEFYGRLGNLMEKKPAIRIAIQQEYQDDIINEWGMTETEMFYWQKWIEPQLKGRTVDFNILWENIHLAG